MPKPRRSSAAGDGPDTRPAFARPPGARQSSGARPIAPRGPSTPKDDSPRRKTRVEITHERRTTTTHHKAKQSPATTPVKKKTPNGGERRKSAGAGGGSPVVKARANAPHKSSPKKSPRAAKYTSDTSTGESSNILSADSLAKLDALNAKTTSRGKAQNKEKKKYKTAGNTKPAVTKRKVSHRHRYSTAPLLEEGRYDEKRIRGGGKDEIWQHRSRRKDDGGGGPRKRKRWLAFLILFIVVLLIILIPVAVVLSKKKNKDPSTTSTTSTSNTQLSTSNLPAESTIPAAAKGTVLDPYTWLDTTDFNTTYTNETVGGLPVMGLSSSWDDSVRANSNVPPLNQNWTYGTTPIRGVNLGGWLSIEPFITPSLFSSYTSGQNVVDEYTLTSQLGATQAAQTLEKHYATFVTEQDFIDIAKAGLDHVRIPYSYWAVTTYDGDPYVPKISWRYLLRGIEWARKHGLRVNLDLHALPGSQNGWNHSGRQGDIRWLNGTDGTLNGQRSLDLHNQLSQFFAQPRYANVIQFYGLVNEPKMLSLPTATVLEWNTQAISIIRKNGMDKYIVFGDGFLALDTWHGQFQNVDDKLVMDTHQYMIFNVQELEFDHNTKLSLACNGWTSMLQASESTSTGWGPILSGEFSQADTDCAPLLNNVGTGSRWTGTLSEPASNTTAAVTSASCPLQNSTCTCDPANADPGDYVSSYSEYLRYLAEAQMYAFENGGWGWFYWTWDTESAVQWSYKKGLAAGIIPALAGSPDYKCVNASTPNFASMGLEESF